MAERLLKVKGTQLYYQDYSEVAHLLTGSIVEGTFNGNLKVKGTYLHWMGNDAVQRRLLGTLTGQTLAAGRIENRGDYLYYGDYNSDERCLALRKPTTQEKVFIGTSVWGQAILNQGMITRTPNGDLYASCGDMGQNHDLDPSAGKPIEIWYSDDDGATWVVSKTIYVEDFYFGGGGNAVCIASDSTGLVHVAFAVRKRNGEEIESINIVLYLHGKHGDWGGTYNIFQVDHATVGDALPKVTSLVVDSNDLAHILFSIDGPVEQPAQMYYLNDPGTGIFDWQLISSDTNEVNHNRLVIDANDTLHLTYCRDSLEKTYYRQKPSGEGWSANVWLGMGSEPYYFCAAMAVDKDNNVHFAVQGHNIGGKGYYRQRSSAGIWGDVEEFVGINCGHPSISILPDSTVYIVSYTTISLFIKRRDPDTETWATVESWDYPGNPCMIHSCYPIIDGQYINIFDLGWAFHLRRGGSDSYYWADP